MLVEGDCAFMLVGLAVERPLDGVDGKSRSLKIAL